MAMKNTEKADMKYTNQRVEILAFLREHEGHPNVDEVYEGVRKKLTRISKATVYKNLKFLTEKGLLEEVNVKGVSRFEANFIPHHHLICRECGSMRQKIPELFRKIFEKFIKNQLSKHNA